MAYLHDPDLEFLGGLDSEDLSDLVDCLIKDKDGNRRLTETLTSSDEYKKYGNDYTKYYKRIAEELQLFGGNTLANLKRGHGVAYREILMDVCDKLKVNYNKTQATEMIEDELLAKTLTDMLDKMSDDEKEKIKKELENSTGIVIKGQITTAIALKLLKLKGFATYQLALKLVNAIWKFLFKKGLKLSANAALTRNLSYILGPVGWTITGAWTIIDIASPAFRVTMPAVFQIALLRKRVSVLQEKEATTIINDIRTEVKTLSKEMDETVQALSGLEESFALKTEQWIKTLTQTKQELEQKLAKESLTQDEADELRRQINNIEQNIKELEQGIKFLESGNIS